MNTVEIVFSPTGGTEKVADIICNTWKNNIVKIDLTDYKMEFSQCSINKDDRVLIAMPSFGGRAPTVAIERLKKISGNGALCTLVCVYGNRAFEDTLAEMEDVAKECGFCVNSAIAAVACHSIISHYASNRPDQRDEKQLIEFAQKIANKIETMVSIPGNHHYKKPGAWLVPKATKNCVKCGVCAENCPVQAIDYVSFKADSKKCIGCMRCVKQCPHDVRKVNSFMVSIAAKAIKKACSIRKENELFI